GHLARSFDRSTGLLDNASTFYFSNIIPQAADNNQGPWAALENLLGDEARVNNREVYIIAGASGSKGTVKGEGKITIPAYTWKVAVIVPRNTGLVEIDDLSDLSVVAVVMPNDPGIRNIPWQTYEVTVDSVEALSGYNLLALLPDPIEIAVESRTKPPVAALDGPYGGFEGASVSMSGAGSSDPDGDPLTYTWSFGDGSFGSGATPSHTYADNGSYTVQLVVTDVRGLADTVTTTATIANVAPTVAAFSGASILPGEVYGATGSFSDPGADSWTATVDYGDGGVGQPLTLAGTSFSLSHRYLAAGSYTVTVAVTDDDGATAMQTATVVVLTPSAVLSQAIAVAQQLEGSGAIGHGNATSLIAKLVSAQRLIDDGKEKPSLAILNGFLQELAALEATGQIGAADAAALRTLVQRVIASIGTT
ncbi:MAG TPA: PKD domain-containing protein, partial [Gemmatimonadaceae bacterium]|nr:PKD domain-containing protein [Gemmatimonadaceae bacterium]